MHRHFFAKGWKALICSLLCFSGITITAAPAHAAEPYQNDYTQKFSDTVTVENTGGDHFQVLESLGTVTGDIVYEADVTLLDDDQLSAALVFGITGESINDSTSVRANFHKKIDWNNKPARVWGYGLDGELTCPGDNGTSNTWFADNHIEVAMGKTVHMKIQIAGQKLTYWLNGVEVCSGNLNGSYTGGKVGLMTYSTKAEFSHIQLNGKEYGNVTPNTDGNGFTINGLYGDAHTVNEAAGRMEAFTYEADVDVIAGQSAALTFGLVHPDQPQTFWYAANYDGLEARLFHVSSSAGLVDLAPKVANNGLDLAQTVHMKLEVERDGTANYYVYNVNANETEKNTPKCTAQLTGYSGGYVGALTFDSSANFHNVTLTKKDATGLTDFTSVNGNGSINIDEANKTVEVTRLNGDHFAMYNGLDRKANDFTFKANVDLKDGASAALVFGANRKNVNPTQWNGANFDQNNSNTFRLFGPCFPHGDVTTPDSADGIDFHKTIYLKLDVKKDGTFTYTFGNVGGEAKVISGTLENWSGGYVGILTCNSDAVFSNIDFIDRTETLDYDQTLANDGSFKTNLTDLRYALGTWNITNEGLYSNAVGSGDAFLYTKTKGTNFVYSTDITFKQRTGAAALVFRSNQNDSRKEAYAVNIDGNSGEYKFWRWQNDEAYQLRDTGNKVALASDDHYHLDVVAYDGWISYYIDGKLVANLGDYTLQEGNLGQTTIIKEGYFGLLNFNSEVVFQNTYYRPLEGQFNPLLKNIQVLAPAGSVEKAGQFTNTASVYMQYVGNETEKINIKADPISTQADVKAYTEDGNEYANLTDIPVSLGKNVITVTSTINDPDKNLNAQLTYRVIVIRRQADYYDETYRDQYHYSVKEGWANDPNGLVKFHGKYHMFYQFYSDTKWGPMHWAHATSEDLITWEEQPMALYPDENGAMFSGCIVADENNTSGLFDGVAGGGLVALITADGNGERIKIAYSTDEGATWTKRDDIAADFINDPIGDGAFRDPKVFRWENKWFMVIAGGPLRIYSSNNLLDWKCEATYPGLHTECPDLYPLIADDGQLKWVLSRGGRFYKVGDFKPVNGLWTFVPDAQYAGDSEANDGVMNFGKDSYAAMTYYVQDFGTVANPTIPELVELNWMNTWNYCNKVALQTGHVFNGTFNLNLTLGLRLENGKYRLTQTPYSGYKTLRGTPTVWKDKTIGANQSDNLDGFTGTSYEIVANLKPQTDTTAVGFKVRKGGSEETVIQYDLNSKNLSINRERSGKIVVNNDNDNTNLFKEINQMWTERRSDGSVDLHIFVDRASVEVFMNNYTAAGANQIFPAESSNGIEVFSNGGETIADITIYPLNSIWKDQAITPVIELDQTEINGYVNEAFTVNAAIYPETAQQAVTWSVDHPELLKVTKADATSAVFTPLKEGTVKITATSKQDPTVKTECQVVIRRNDLKTNLTGFTNKNGWMIDGESYQVNTGEFNAFTFANAPAQYDVYTYSADVKVTGGLFNMILESHANPYDGSYALQLEGSSGLVRLFDFKGDHEFIRQANGLPAGSSAQDCHVDIVKDGNRLIVYIDGQQAADYTISDPDRQYNTGVFGFGMWDGEAEVSNIYVRRGYPSKAISSMVADVTISDLATADDALKLLPKTVDVIDINDNELDPQTITWDLSGVPFGTVGSYVITGTTESGLTTTTNLIIVVDKTPLETAINKAESLKQDEYEPDSWTALVNALAEAKAVLADPDADGSAIVAAADKLNKVMDQMIRLNHVVIDQNGYGEVRGNLKAGAVLIIDSIIDQSNALISSSALKYYDVHALYEATMYVNGEVYDPSGTIELRLNLPKARAQRNYILARVVNGQLLILTDSHVENGQIVANVDRLGTYAIISIKDSVKDEDDNPVENDTPADGETTNVSTSKGVNTGDSTQPITVMSWMIIGSFVLCLAMKKRQNEE